MFDESSHEAAHPALYARGRVTAGLGASVVAALLIVEFSHADVTGFL
jgi:hypothetical protein